MAERTYLFTPEEQAQFERLQTLGFERTNRLAGTEEASVFWHHPTDKFDCIFFTEPYVFDDEDDARELYWHVQVHGKTNSGLYNCVVCDHWLTLAQFDCVTSPQHWETVRAVLPDVRGSVALAAFLESLDKTT